MECIGTHSSIGIWLGNILFITVALFKDSCQPKKKSEPGKSIHQAGLQGGDVDLQNPSEVGAP
jgi:hypothetical protein